MVIMIAAQREYTSKQTGRLCYRISEEEFINTLYKLKRVMALSRFKFTQPYELIFKSAVISNAWDILQTKDRRLSLESPLFGSIEFDQALGGYVLTQFGDDHYLGALRWVMIDKEDLDNIITLTTADKETARPCV